MTRHNLEDVGQKIQQATRSFIERALVKILDDTELRMALQLANEGKPRLAIERLSLAILDLEARAADLERAKEIQQEIQQATPEQYAEHARDWKRDFPGSEPPTIWSIERK